MTAIAGGNVTGAVSFATTANSVAVGNVSGIGNIATINLNGNASQILYGNGVFAAAPSSTYGNSNVATFLASYGSNTITTTGNVSVGNIIGTHYGAATGLTSIPGGNVSGAVTYATTANSVAVGNVSGIGNIATINKDGNASNVLYGNGVFASSTAAGGYGNSNVATFLASYGSNTITTTGNVSVGNIIGTHYGAATGLTSIPGANVTGTVPTATSATTAGTVTTAAQPNITSVGTLTSVSVSGTSNLGAVGNVTITGGTNGYVLSTNGSGLLSWVAQSGGGGSTSSISNGNSNVNIATANGNVTMTAVGNTIVTVTGTGANISGTLSASGNINGANIVGTHYGAATGLTSIPGANVTGTVPSATSAGIAGQLTNAVTFDNSGLGSPSGITYNGAATRTISYNTIGAPSTSGTNASGTWSINVSGSAGSATTAGTVTTAAQPNITSVGSLSSLAVSGNITGGNLSVSGSVTATSVININNYTGTSASITGNITGANIIATSYHIRSVGTSLSAAGSTQGTGTVLSKEFNQVSTVTSGQGVVLPSGVAGMAITITNSSANSLLVYPASGGAINALSTNAAYTLPTLATIQYITLTGTQWYTVGASYA